jgi:hypothetical protein
VIKICVVDQNPISSATLTLNGHERFSPRPGEYFQRVQPFSHALRCPSKPIMMYSFALNPFDTSRTRARRARPISAV